MHEKGGLSVYAAVQMVSNELSQSVDVKLAAISSRPGQVEMVCALMFEPSARNTPAQDCGTEK